MLLIGYTYSIFMKPQSCSDIQITTLNTIIPENKTKSKAYRESIAIIEKDSFPTKHKISKAISKNKNQKTKTAIKLRLFDPNEIDSLEWISLGVPYYNIKTILNFQRKGGRFYKCEDLKKIYGLKESLINELLPYCTIEQIKKEKIVKSSTRININKADSMQLCKIYGIGPKLSARIIKFRNRIGGFHTVNQLLEVWGIEKEVIDNNSTILFCDGNIKHININEVDFQTLNQHIYFDYKQTKAIINYRNQHGPFLSVESLKEIVILNDSVYNKIVPYLTIK